ncbi:hypothetical protein [Blautia sp. MSJ-9]|uniref:hypothetical protein n=1 Tax=Blautia sp. MSJ-9 TaxID=2841511 RepID=UPI000E50EFE6|nr:hypothetical protein [Blautia sp. MSJ-9]MBU5680542.1 hypothetical protein [Blautia sp. MSJ-9]RHG54182.1 hypothetical protein DW253_12105 [Ruminococcus sp. AM22-13]
MSETKYISEIISEEEINRWKPGDNIFLYNGTGTGKTTFVNNKLANFVQLQGKKILQLEPRLLLKRQQRKEVTTAAIDVESYQSLESIKNFEKYLIVVLDECHYLFSDSGINDLTDRHYNILKSLNCIKIWITATPDDVFEYFHSNLMDYKLYPKDYTESKVINEIYTYKSDEELENILEFVAHDTNVKAMVVMSSTKKLLKMYRKYEDVSSIVLGSGNLSGKTAKMKKAISSEIAKISEDKVFSGQKFLFGTSALDCGVSMRDYSFSIIIIDGIYDIQTIKQIVGRKRKQDDCDVAALYIRNISNSTLNGFNSAEKRWIKPAHILLTKGIDYYLEWYLKNGNRYPDKHRIIRDEKINGVLTKTVNDKKLTFFENRIQRTTDMIRRGKNGFLLTLKDAFGINISPWNDDAKIYTEKLLEDHYQKQTVWWNRSETQEFAKSLGFTDKYRHIITSYKAINAILENQYKSTYRIVCKRKKKKVDGKVKRFDNVWMIEKSR